MAFEVFKVDQPKGVNFTKEPSQLPATVWDEAQNVTFRHGITKKVTGYEQGFGKTGENNDSSLFPESVLSLRDDTQDFYWWAYASFDSENKAKLLRITSANVHTDVTPVGDIIKDDNFSWTNDSINAVPYFTYQQPYRWDGSTQFERYTYFPDHIKVDTVRTYRNFHIGMNFETVDFDPSAPPLNWGSAITDEEAREEYAGTFGPWNAGKHQNAIWWSSDVIGKDTDVVWSDADPTKSSGWNFLGGAGGPIIDGKTMRDSFMIYRERSVWQMTYVGGINVFAFKEVFTDAGCLGKDCVAEIEGQHFVVGQSDIYGHNGVQKTSIADGVTRKEIFDSIDPSYIRNVFIATKYQDKELWVCIPEASTNIDGKCNIAFVYNWEEKTWSRRNIPNMVCSAYTILSISEGDISWNAESEGGPVDASNEATSDIGGSTWNEATDTWNDSYFKYNPSQWGLMFGGSTVDGTGGALYTSIKEPLEDGNNIEATVEKRWMDMGDRAQYKTINKIYPLVRNGIVDCYIAGTSTVMEAPVWKFIGEFDPSVRMHLACHATGRFLHVKFVIKGDSRAELRGYAVDFVKSGRR